MSVDVNLLKKIREETGAGIADVRMAIEEANGDEAKAKEVLKKKGLDKAASKSDREVKAGLVSTYSHGGRIASVVELLCETDFVAKTEDFQNLSREIAMQVASMNPENVEELMKQEYIRDASQTIESLLQATVAKLGENIQIGKFVRIELGK